MIKTIIKTLLLIGTLGYLVFALVKLSRPTDEMVCTGVEYLLEDSSEARLINREMVENLLARKKISPKGKKLADLNIEQIEQYLSGTPYIDTVTCYNTASGKLFISVKPMHPILHVMANDGDEYYVDRNGTILPAEGLAADLCIVTGHVTRKYASTKLIPLGILLKEDAYWSRQAQQVNVDSKGNIEIIPQFAEQKICLGQPKDFTEKLERVRIFYEKAMPKAGWNKYNVVDATYANQIICKKE